MDVQVVEICFSFVAEEREYYQQIRQQLSLLERAGRIRCRSQEDVQLGFGQNR